MKVTKGLAAVKCSWALKTQNEWENRVRKNPGVSVSIHLCWIEQLHCKLGWEDTAFALCSVWTLCSRMCGVCAISARDTTAAVWDGLTRTQDDCTLRTEVLLRSTQGFHAHRSLTVKLWKTLIFSYGHPSAWRYPCVSTPVDWNCISMLHFKNLSFTEVPTTSERALTIFMSLCTCVSMWSQYYWF